MLQYPQHLLSYRFSDLQKTMSKCMYRKTKSEVLEKWCRRFGRFSWCVGLQPVSTFVHLQLYFLTCVCSETPYLVDWASSLQPQLNLLLHMLRCLILIPREPPHSLPSQIDFGYKIYATTCKPGHKPHSSAALALFGLYRGIYLIAPTIYCLDNLRNVHVEAEGKAWK